MATTIKDGQTSAGNTQTLPTVPATVTPEPAVVVEADPKKTLPTVPATVTPEPTVVVEADPKKIPFEVHVDAPAPRFKSFPAPADKSKE